jgi:hypothetical protein
MEENKKTKKISKVILGIILFVVVFCLFVVIWSTLYDEEENTVRSKFYAIDPETLLQDVENGNLDAAFDPIEVYRDYNPERYRSPIDWSPDDYYYMLSEFFTHVTGDNLNNWKIHRVEFAAECNTGSIGYTYFSLEVFKDTRIDGKPYRWMRYIYIDPVWPEAYFWEAEIHNNNRFPAPSKWKSINYQELPISVDEAMQLVLRQYDSELTYWNETCDRTDYYIYISNEADKHRGNWQITIYDDADERRMVLDVLVNETSGKMLRSDDK